ncbi:hypothetical protein N9D23_00565 [Rubripirellula sp.]|nr:hypothetical protein [Rubripirellula sp.]
MNKKERKRRRWKIHFKRKYQQEIWKTIEQQRGVPAEKCCVYIAYLAERLSEGRLTVNSGVLVVDDQGPDADPLGCAHCWNELDGERIDLSPWGECRFPKRYLTQEDGDDYHFYLSQTAPFGDVPRECLDADIDSLLLAMNEDVDVISPLQIITTLAGDQNFLNQNSGQITR